MGYLLCPNCGSHWYKLDVRRIYVKLMCDDCKRTFCICATSITIDTKAKE